MPSRGDQPSRQEQAAAWFAALRVGVMPAEQRVAFDAWRADPRNQAALDAMHELWGELAVLKHTKPPRVASDRRWLRMAAAILVAILGLGGAAGWLALRGDQTIATAAGEQRTQALPDGSFIAVNVVSQVSYAMNDDRRVVSLNGGEAAFIVKPDASRPFIVHSGDYEVRAIGTAFNVRQRDDALEIAVGEGRVEICARSGPSAGVPFATLEAGQLLRLPADYESGTATSARPRPVPADQISEWRMRVVTYENAAVSDVVDDINRYFARKLEIDDKTLQERRVTIRLHIEDRDRAIETLASLLGVRVRRSGEEDVLTDTP